MLQKYDYDDREAQDKFTLQRDEAHRKFLAALWGVELEDDSPKQTEPPRGARNRVITRQNTVKNYKSKWPLTR